MCKRQKTASHPPSTAKYVAGIFCWTSCTCSLLWPLWHAIQWSLNQDCKQCMETLGHKINKFIHKQHYHEAWNLLQPFYHWWPHIFAPNDEILQQIGAGFRELYQCTPPKGDPNQKFDIPDTIPDETKIAKAIQSLWSKKAPGPSGISNNDIKTWCNQCKHNPLPWVLLTDIIQDAFQTGTLPTLLHCNILVFIPKTKLGKVRGIGLLESLWKLFTTIIHKHLMKNIVFHLDMHGFLPKQGCSTASIKAKLQMQYAHCTSQPLFQVFINISKAYEGLDQECTLTLLQDYAVGTNTLWILNNFWTQHTIIPWQQDICGTPFSVEQGVTQGMLNNVQSPTSPLIQLNASFVHSIYLC